MWKKIHIFNEEGEHGKKFIGDMAQWTGYLTGKHAPLSLSPTAAHTRCGGTHLLSQHLDDGGRKIPGDGSGKIRRSRSLSPK